MTPSDRVEIRDYRLDLILVQLIYKSFIISEYIIMMTQPFLQDIQINRILRDHCIILNSIKLYHLLLDFPFYLSPWLPLFLQSDIVCSYHYCLQEYFEMKQVV